MRMDSPDTCDAYLRKVGVKDKLREAIKSPFNYQVRCTQTALHWILESIENHYHWLKGNQAVSFELGRRIQERRAGDVARSGVQD